jgi:predicted amino acid-binding ACT domain protein
MIQISINKNSQITNQASFPTMEEAQAWLAHHEGMKSFGQPKQIVQQQIELEPAVLEKQMVMIKEARLDEEGNELSPAEFEEQDVVIKEAVVEMQEVELAGDYEIIIEDISQQIEQEKINAEALALLASTDFKVLRHIRQKALGQELSLSEEEYLALEQQRADAAASIVR